MQQHEAIDGVVVRVRDMGDHDRYLSVLTADRGRITLLAKGSHSVRGAQSAISQLYTYGNFEYYRKGSIYILKGGSVNNSFYELSRDIDRLNLAAYLCEVACEVTDEGEAAESMLRLLLNSLYAISKELYPQEIIKGAFELRAAAESGYEPELSRCASCGLAEWELGYLDVMNGSVLCPECLKKRGRAAKNVGAYDDIREAEILCPISSSVRVALEYCVCAPLGRLFSFELTDAEDLRAFAKAAQTYLLSHLGRGFDSLDFYNMMRDPKYSAKGT